ncbi:SPOR domain-containing protein [Pseudoalteromonas tunicata]|uniref:SPOR domain-containing protein n=1 Tax=Pseudoalteromonas tunicata D2 TaxID=87626 RepID=A4C6I5_9GAMM|nr:SPOR domain-containing protein [Pseudoalteromonas tunicata]ATC95563.1 hypothetical protein PTUN_a3185 [Pseudoalteromonas tunicata]AXT31135.1 hypothetical protein D1819_10190 [Pseudoalteromonas tunicata]EAR29589.1 hypothetical protein PTD2_12254 [Pseudoalteromonas tunicata D2]
MFDNKVIVSFFKQYLVLLVVCMSLSSAKVYAESFTKVVVDENEYILVDVAVNDWTLLTNIEIYQVGEQYFIPFLTIAEALEIKNSSRLNDNYLNVVIGDKSYWLDINKQQSNLEAASTLLLSWADSDFDRLLSLELFSLLIDSNIEYDSSKLKINITSKKEEFLFPVEIRMNRSQEDKRIKKMRISNKEPAFFKSQEVLLDHYHLITPPSGNVGFSVFSSNKNNLNYSTGINLSSDLLFHSAILSLGKGKDSDLRGNLRFFGAPDSPDEKLPFGITNYEFGDISMASTGVNASGYGVGVTFRSDNKNYSRDFGKTVIEGQAVPGWEAELYSGSYFIAQQKVSENGTYRFEDVVTEYGVNTFKVKLFGPYGESEERIETIKISGSWLKPGENRFKGGFVDNNSFLLHGGVNGYSPDNLYYAWDYGISDDYQLGIGLAAQRNRDTDPFDKELTLKLQSTFTDLIVNNELSIDNNKDINASVEGLGQINESYNYGFRYNYFKRNIETGNLSRDFDTHSLSANINGYSDFIFPLGYSLGAGAINTSEGTRLNRVNARVSWNTFDMNFYNNLEYVPVENKKDYYRGSFGFSTHAAGGRINMETSYKYEDTFDLTSTRINFNKDFENGYSMNGRAEYFRYLDENNPLLKEWTDEWEVTSSVTKSFELFNVSALAQFDSEHNWSIGLGVNFSLGYDHINNELQIANGGLFGGGTLDLTAYLDRNSNNILDENDLALEGVEFGPYQSWKGRKTGSTGRVVMQGVPSNKVVNFSGAWKRGVSPSVSSYSLYTHNGGYIKANIPFTIKTDVIGFLYSGINDSGDAIKDVEIQLVDHNQKLIGKTITSHDGYYEFTNVNAGNYHIRIDLAFLDARGLKSQPGVFELSTPPQGGFVEVEPFYVYARNNDVAIDAVKKVEFNTENYDPAIEQTTAGKGIFVKADKKIFKESTFKRKPVQLKSATVVKNNFTQVKAENSFIETKINGSDVISEIESTAPSIEQNEIETIPADVIAEVNVPVKVNNDWGLQFGSYENEANAQDDLNKLSRKIPNLKLQVVSLDNFFKLLAIGFSSYDEAAVSSQQLRLEQNVDSFVTKVKSNLAKVVNNPKISQIEYDNYFSIQVAAVKSLEQAKEIYKKLPADFDYYTGENQKNIILFIGLYSNKQEALAALETNVGLNGWVRSLKNVKNINKVN